MDKAELTRADKRISPDGETGTVNLLSDSIECPLCAGRGKLARIEFFEKTGMREPSLIADLSATSAVERMHAKLWGDFRAQLGEQVAARTRELEKQLLELEGEKGGLEKDIASLLESKQSAIEQAKKEQELTDQHVLSKEKQAVQDQMAMLKGELAKATADLEAATKQQGLNTRDATEKVKDEEKALRHELQARIDQMNEALVEEQKAKVELENKLRRLEIEVESKVAEARRVALEEKDKELGKKADEARAIEDELRDLKAREKLFPEQKDLAVKQAIQDLEKNLHGKELDLQNLRKERDGIQEALTEAERRLEASKGKVEERTFEKLVAEIPGVWIEDWHGKNKSGDYHIGLYDKDGEKLLSSKIVIDNKDVGRLTDEDINKLVRDALHHNVALAAMVVSDESALRPKDKDARFCPEGGVTLLRTTREWFLRDLDLLKPLMRRQADEGPDFMKRNVAVATEVRSHLKTLDHMEKFMRLARENAEKAEKELKKYRNTLDDLCRNAGAAGSGGAGEEE